MSAGASAPAEPERVIALVAPHIDYERGGNTYGLSYRVFQDLPRPDVIFLIGTSHQASNACFHLSAKDLETPFGVLPCDRHLVAEINAQYTYRDLLAEEILHRTEHSLELQLPFLGLLLEAQKSKATVNPPKMPTVVPILVGSFEPFFDLPIEASPGGPRFHPEVAEFIATLGNLMRKLEAQGRSFLWILGVDFAHVGQHFGDKQPLQAGDADAIEVRDRLLLKTVCDRSADDLFCHVAEDRDKRRICGYSSLYTVLGSLEHAGIAARGNLLDYQQAIDLKSDQLVSVASLVLERV